MIYENECYTCEHKWESNVADEVCPQCSETYNIGTDPVEEDES